MPTARKRSTQSTSGSRGTEPLPAEALRWRCDPHKLPFESTADVEPIAGIVGQDTAVEALRFGLETNAPGQNVYVRGLSGTGRLSLVRRLLEETRPACPETKDCCYVYNFSRPERPRLITLPPGQGQKLRRLVDKLANFVRDDLGAALSSEGTNARRNALDRNAEKRLKDLVEPFDKDLKDAGLKFVSVHAGTIVQTAIFPLVDGKPVPPEEFDELHDQGAVTEEHSNAVQESLAQFEPELSEINRKANEIRRSHEEAVGVLLEKAAHSVLGEMTGEIEAAVPDPSVKTFLDELVDDVVKNHLADVEEQEDFTRLYRVNVVLDHTGETSCPIIVENVPTMRNLLGTIDHDFEAGEQGHLSHMGIRAGSLLRADGGYLILEDRDSLGEPGTWKILKRVLRTGQLEIMPRDMPFPGWTSVVKPEPIEIKVKVVMLGGPETYYLLDEFDPDFPQLFKVLADFDTVIPRDDTGVNHYAAIFARIAQEEHLSPLDRSAVTALAEQGARIAARSGKLTARFGRLADIVREAAFICGKQNRPRVTGDDVREAVRRGKQRADLPSRHFREAVADGTICLNTAGLVVGQINGLAVLQAGPMVYGFPTRITATIGPGTAGVINIEGEAELSGAIHTKGFYILGGLLRFLLRTDHPLAFDASVAFEQSYGGIDGDSASGAEICCLLSALTDIPMRQDLAVTGAIDQMGHILAVGAVNEKIEGFFDACRDLGMTGTQGVIIPKANAGDLMLREDVVEACGAGQFHVYPVETVHQALELLSGMPAGMRKTDGRYPKGTLLGRAVDRAREYWLKAARPPSTRTGRSSKKGPKARRVARQIDLEEG